MYCMYLSTVWCLNRKLLLVNEMKAIGPLAAAYFSVMLAVCVI